MLTTKWLPTSVGNLRLLVQCELYGGLPVSAVNGCIMRFSMDLVRVIVKKITATFFSITQTNLICVNILNYFNPEEILLILMVGHVFTGGQVTVKKIEHVHC